MKPSTRMRNTEMALGDWFTLSIAEQLASVGSEYECALRWKQQHNEEAFQHALGRMMELLDLTIADPRWQNHRLKELTLLKEFIIDELSNEVRKYPDSRDLREYFRWFGSLADKQQSEARNRPIDIRQSELN
jgi:hypothetical protein